MDLRMVADNQQSRASRLEIGKESPSAPGFKAAIKASHTIARSNN
jgi:hypothetical protein